MDLDPRDAGVPRAISAVIVKLLNIALVAGARPNFMKIGPLWKALVEVQGVQPVIVHTGQHYDLNMSEVFFKDLQLPTPDYVLGVGSGSHSEQTGLTMIEFEKTCQALSPSAVVVVGDVNATLACSLSAVKMGIPVAHVEAGLRSGDRSMPEEINRVVTDHISDWLYAPSSDATDNLVREGIGRERILMSGNIMIDSLISLLPRTRTGSAMRKLGISSDRYILLTLHRPSNVDDPDRFGKILDSVGQLGLPVIFPMHPRTRPQVSLGMERESLVFCDPLSYVDFLSLTKGATLVITDSGGIQEETTFLKVPCLTLRETTERPITISIGTNQLTHLDTLHAQAAAILRGDIKEGRIPPCWDGRTAKRISDHLVKALCL